jgi:hypothetical protein
MDRIIAVLVVIWLDRNESRPQHSEHNVDGHLRCFRYGFHRRFLAQQLLELPTLFQYVRTEAVVVL